MKRLKVCFLLIIILATTPLCAQFTPESSKFKIEGGYLWGKGESNDFSLEGSMFSGTFEHMTRSGNVSYSILAGYLSVSEETILSNNVPVYIELSSLPIVAGVNYYFTESRIATYAGFGLGVHFTNLKSSANNPKESDRGMVVNVPIGVDFYVLKNLALGVNYKFYYLGSSYFNNGLIHTLNVGAGLTFW